MIGLPFKIQTCNNECGTACGKDLAKCPTYRRLPPKLREKCQTNLNLLRYINSLPLDDIGVPHYYEKLTRSMKDMPSPNLFYPLGNSTFIHILENTEDVRDHYIIVEPCFGEETSSYLDVIEERLADFVEELEDISDDKGRLEIILGIVDRLVQVSDKNNIAHSSNSGNGSEHNDKDSSLKTDLVEAKHNNGNGNGNGSNHHNGSGRKSGFSLFKGFRKSKTKEKITMTANQYNSVRYLLQRSLEGLGLIEPMMQDPNIEDISCSGLGHVFVEHKIFGGLRSTIGFETHQDLDKFAIQLAERIKHPVTFRDPCVDASLPDGSRINIVYGTDVSKRGTNFTIRKFQEVPISVIELCQFGTLSYEMAAYLSLILQEQMSIFVAGETASGKTTLLNAITTFITPNAKIVSIEDTPEIQVPHPNWIRGVTRGDNKKGAEMSEVSMFDLLKASLRQRPNMIIIGEIRGIEGNVAFQAMQTGHACMSTFHAASVTKLIQRLSGNPINVPKSYIDSLNLVIIVQAVRLPNGMTARRITSINEIVKYDSVNDTFAFVEVFSWNPTDDTFDFKGNNNSMLLEEKIAPKRGLPPEKRRQIYSLLKQRAEVLSRLSERKITDFFQVYNVLSKGYREGYFR